MTVPSRTVVDSFREAVQDLLVPELKALRVSVDSLRTEMQLRDDKLQESIDAVRTEMQLRDGSLRKEMELRDEMLRAELKLRDENLKAELNLRDETLRAEIHAGDTRTQDMVLALSQKLDFAIDIRERLIALEARLPRQ